jgi:hypothetical protein
MPRNSLQKFNAVWQSAAAAGGTDLILGNVF